MKLLLTFIISVATIIFGFSVKAAYPIVIQDSRTNYTVLSSIISTQESMSFLTLATTTNISQVEVYGFNQNSTRYLCIKDKLSTSTNDCLYSSADKALTAGWNVFTLNPPFNVNSNTRYFIYLIPANGTSWTWDRSTANPYSNGGRCLYTSTDYSSCLTTNDYRIRIYGNEIIVDTSTTTPLEILTDSGNGILINVLLLGLASSVFVGMLIIMI